MQALMVSFWRRQGRAWAALALVMALLWLLGAWLAASSQSAGPDLPERHPRLESALRDLAAAQADGGVSAAADLAVRHGVTWVDGLARVVVVAKEEDDQPAIAHQIEALGGRVEMAYGPWSQALLPVEALPNIADAPGVRFVRRPWRPLALTISQGVAVTRADEWQWAGYTGQGAKVGVLDLGFLGYTNRISEGELPSDVITKSFVGDGSEFDFWGQPLTQHGVACAEIVYDMAPDAQLYLVNVSTEVEWANAVDWLVAQGVDVISFSGGWSVGGPGDGTGTLADKVSDVRNAGVLWVNAAGNSARRHWMGQWNDWDKDGWHNFSGASETNKITVTGESLIVVGLRWDEAWGGSSDDYDLFLFDSSMTEVARSDNVQDNDDDPLERIVYYFPSPGIYHLAISRQPGEEDRTLELFSEEHDLHFRTAASSLWVPADSPGSLTVGATYWQNSALEDSSSRGPTRDGRVKPDLVAPDGVSVNTETWRSSGFYGTSASAPHVAGAAAVVLQVLSAATPTETQNWLEGRAVDLGSVGKDNAYGAGRLSLGDPPLTVLRVEPAAGLQGQTVMVSVIGASFAPTATLRFTRTGQPDLIPVSTGWITTTRLSATLDLGGKAIGLWTAVVTHSAMLGVALPDAFLVASDQVYLPLVMRNAWP
jgi:subtilisin family serine protease